METDEVLETGYEPATPPGDTLLFDYVQGESVSYVALAEAQGGRVEHDRELGLCMTDTGSQNPFGNISTFERPLVERDLVEATRRLHAFYADAPGGSFALISTWPTPDLRPQRFGLVGHPPLMLREAGPLRAAPAELAVAPVRTAAEFESWEYVMVYGYPAPEMQPFEPGRLMKAGAIDAPGWHFFLGTLDGEPVATGAAFADDRHVRVDFISCLPDHRGKGYGEALTAAATMAGDGDQPATLISSDLGRPVYERMGYRALLRCTFWAGHRGAT